MLFESKLNVDECKDNDLPNKERKVPPESIIEKRNILNRNRAQLIQDQTEDVTLSNLNVSDIAPMGKEGFFRLNNVLCTENLLNILMRGYFMLIELLFQRYIDRKY